MWVATQDFPRSAAHPFYARLNQILDLHDFDGFVEGLCERYYADEGRPGLPPGRYFRLLLIGYFEGLDAERAIAWRAADSFALREFLGLVLPETPPDHSTISRTRRLIDLETHEAVFTWMLHRLADAGLLKGKTVRIDARRLLEVPICSALVTGTIRSRGSRRVRSTPGPRPRVGPDPIRWTG
jgi:transposase